MCVSVSVCLCVCVCVKVSLFHSRSILLTSGSTLSSGTTHSRGFILKAFQGIRVLIFGAEIEVNLKMKSHRSCPPLPYNLVREMWRQVSSG